MLEQNHEAAQSALSYGVGGGAILGVTLIEIAETAEALAIIAGCIVVLVRLVHDSIRLWRYIRKK